MPTSTDPRDLPRAVLFGTGVQFALLLGTLQFHVLPESTLYWGGLVGGTVAGSLAGDLWDESTYNGGVATTLGAIVYFLCSAGYSILDTMYVNQVFAPQIIGVVTGLAALFFVPVVFVEGLIGGYFGFWVRRALA